MKSKFLKYLMILIAAISFAGCYTVMWTPDKEFPTADTTSNVEQYGYYNDQYYGDYAYYYGYPWWYSITPPAPYYTPGSAYVRDTSGAMQSLRNGMGGRGTDGRSILHTAPAARTVTSASDSGSSSNSSAGNSGSNNSNYNRTETTNSGSNSSAARSNSTQKEGTNSARNNNGGRNNNGRK